MIWDEKYECMPREKLRELQLARLKSVVGRVYEKVPYFRDKLDGLGIKPDDIKSLEDLPKLPFMTKHELRKPIPSGFSPPP